MADNFYNKSGGSDSPLTTKGDIWGYSTQDTRVPVGTDGQVLTADAASAAGVKWAAASGGANTALSNLASTAINADLVFDNSADHVIQTANNAAAITKSLTIKTGALTGSGAGTNTGNLTLTTGTVSEAGDWSGNTTLSTGSSDSGGSGNLVISSGLAAGSGPTGNVSIQTGVTSGTRGKIYLKEGSEGTAGHVWTSYGTSGEGRWEAPGGGLASDWTSSNSGTVAAGGSGPYAALIYSNSSPQNVFIGSANRSAGSASVFVATGDVDSSNTTGSLNLLSGGITDTAVNGTSGAIYLQSGDVANTATGNTGQVRIGSGVAGGASGSSGHVYLAAGETSGSGVGGNLNIGAQYSGETSGYISIVGGETGDNGNGGLVSISGGAADGEGFNGGDLILEGGVAFSGADNSGNVSIRTIGANINSNWYGSGNDHAITGNITIETGNADTDSGLIVLKTGTAGDGDRGYIDMDSLFAFLPRQAADPTHAALAEGAMYYNTGTDKLRLYAGGSWVSAATEELASGVFTDDAVGGADFSWSRIGEHVSVSSEGLQFDDWADWATYFGDISQTIQTGTAAHMYPKESSISFPVQLQINAGNVQTGLMNFSNAGAMRLYPDINDLSVAFGTNDAIAVSAFSYTFYGVSI